MTTNRWRRRRGKQQQQPAEHGRTFFLSGSLALHGLYILVSFNLRVDRSRTLTFEFGVTAALRVDSGLLCILRLTTSTNCRREHSIARARA